MNALLDEYTDAQVAAILNERGLRTGASEAFAAVILAAPATSRERPDRACVGGTVKRAEPTTKKPGLGENGWVYKVVLREA